MEGRRSFVSSTRLIAGFTLISRILGFVRDAVCAWIFGASHLWDAFAIAFQIPNLARRLFGEGALSAAFVPILTDAREHHGEECAARLAGSVLSLLMIVLLVMVLIGEFILATVHWFRPSLTTSLTATLLPYAVFICLVAFVGGLLNVYLRFGAPAAAPVILNLFMITGAILAARWSDGATAESLYILAGFVVAAGMVQLIFQWHSVKRAGIGVTWNLDWRDESVRRLMRMMGPMILGLSAVQLNTLADALMAEWLVARSGAVSTLYYAQRLYQFPLGVFAIAIATALFPLLSARSSAGDDAGLGDVCLRGLRLSLFIAIPSAAGLIMIAQPLVSAVFERGAFTRADTDFVAATLTVYAIGLPAFAAHHILVRTFYAKKDSRTPMRISCLMVGLNLILNLILVLNLSERGIALATVLTAALQAWLLARFLVTRLKLSISWSAFGIGVVVNLAAAGAMCGAIWLNRMYGLQLTWVVASVLADVVLGAVVYAGVSRLMGVKELSDILRLRNAKA